MREFDFIDKYLKPLAQTLPGALDPLGLGDDAALLECAPGTRLVLAKDLIVEGVHFLPGEAPDVVAKRALRVNLSDLAAMGAKPVGYMLGLAPSHLDEDWLKGFAQGLREEQAAHGIALLGGDTVHLPGGLVVSVSVVGSVKDGQALQRDAAQAGQDLYISGTLGDAALGLSLLQEGADVPKGLDVVQVDWLAERYRLPQPRVALGQALADAGVRCAVDVSDGLMADAGHMAERSVVGLDIDPALLPLSEAARLWLDAHPAAWRQVLSGGDDYELLFTAAPNLSEAVHAAAKDAGVPITRIGKVVPHPAGVRILDNFPAGVKLRELNLDKGGYEHV